MPTDALTPDEPDTSLDPYETLDISSEANEAEIRSAYKKLALRNHPDKVAASDRDAAHKRFQQIAFAYGVLSDAKRRRRYDTTGSTAESALDDEDFDWADFFKARYTEITTERILEFQTQYQNSEEEKRDLLKAYQKMGGRMGSIYQLVMLSNPLDDEERFQKIIREAIDNEEVPGYDAFLKESARSQKKRLDQARKEAEEAEEYAEELGVGGAMEKRKKKFEGDVEVDGEASSDEDEEDGEDEEHGEDDEEPQQTTKRARGKATTKAKAKAKEPAPKAKKPSAKSNGAGLGDLAAMIAQRQQSRSKTFLDDMEAKYAPKSKGKKRKPMDEPPEEAFARTASRRSPKKAKS